MDQNKNRTILPYANIRIIKEIDTTFVKGCVTDKNGNFRINFISKKKETYLLEVSYIGMEMNRIILNNDILYEDIGSILMKDGVKLGEIVVWGNLPDVKQVGDTTIINTNVYKVSKGAYFEELMKRIPGLEYDFIDGTLSYNSKSINEIRVNGKSFFSGNIQFAIKNLPAEFVGKIKVYNKKKELEHIVGLQAKDSYVLDIQTKETFEGKLLVSGKLGYGDKEKKDFELLGNYFRNNGDNISIIGRLTNQDIYTDYTGNKKVSAALNTVKNIGDKITVNGSVMYNNDVVGTHSNSYNEQYLTNECQYTYLEGNNVNDNRAISSNIGLRWNINPKMYIDVKGNLNYMQGENSIENKQITFGDDIGYGITSSFDSLNSISENKKINDNIAKSLLYIKQWQYLFNVSLVRKINDKGTTIGINVQKYNSLGKHKNFSKSSIRYYNLNKDSISYTNRYSLNPTENGNSTFTLFLSHQMFKRLSMQISYNLNGRSQKYDRNIYDLSQFSSLGDAELAWFPKEYQYGYVDSLSSYSNSKSIGHEVSVFLNYTKDKFNMGVGVKTEIEKRMIKQKTVLIKSDTVAHNINWKPSFSVSWQNKDYSLNLNYQGITIQPSLSDLLTVADNSNPLYIIKGNPKLKPTYNQLIQLDAQNTSYGLFMSWNICHEFNSQVRSMKYDKSTGARESMPINVNGNWNTNAMARYQKKIKNIVLFAKSRFLYTNNINEIEEDVANRSVTQSIEFNEELGCSFYPKWGNINLMGGWTYQNSKNNIYQMNINTYEYIIKLDGFVRILKNVQLKNDIYYLLRTGSKVDSNENNQLIWNIEATWSFLKKKQCDLSVCCSDLFNQRKIYNRNATSTILSEDYTKQIGRYFIFSLKYHF